MEFYDLIRRSYRVPSGVWRWVIVGILLAPVSLGVVAVMAVYIGGDAVPEILTFSFSLLMWRFFLGGPVGEEMGWRGFALDRLQNKYNALISSLILGFFWWVWHIPIYLVPSGRMPLALFILFVVSQSINIYMAIQQFKEKSFAGNVIPHCTELRGNKCIQYEYGDHVFRPQPYSIA